MSPTSPFAILASGPSSRDAAAYARTLLLDAGYEAGAPSVVQPAGVSAAVQQAASGAGAVIVIGGMGVGASGTTRAALQGLLQAPVQGFSDLYRLVSYRDAGADALLHDAAAGYVAGTLVVALPADSDAVERAIEELLLPTLGALLGGAAGTSSLPAPAAPSDSSAAPADSEISGPEPDATADDDEPRLPPPAPRWQLGATRVATEAAPIEAEQPSSAEAEGLPDRGWKRAVYDLQGELVRGKSPDTPQNLEDFAPFMEILHQAGERARLDLPSGVKLDLYGFPDLQRANSKVIAVGWGEPLAEVIALHRYPSQTGLCIEEGRGLMPQRTADIRAIAQAITGRAPPDCSGELFAIEHDAVYIQRGKWVFRWDGRRERQEGNPKQTLVTLALGWHNR